jgi:hypothetical protein
MSRPVTPVHDAARAETDEPSVKPFADDDDSDSGPVGDEDDAVKTRLPARQPHIPGDPFPVVQDMSSAVKQVADANARMSAALNAFQNTPETSKTYSDADPGPGKPAPPARSNQAPMTPADGTTIQQVCGEGPIASAISSNAGKATLQVQDQDAASRLTSRSPGGHAHPLPHPAGPTGIDRANYETAPISAAKSAPPPARMSQYTSEIGRRG